VQPGTARRSVALDPQYGSSCAMNQDLAQVYVAPFTDPKQLRLAASRVLAWHDPEPCRELSALAKRSTVPDGCNNGRRHDRPDAGDLPYQCAAGIRSRDPF